MRLAVVALLAVAIPLSVAATPQTVPPATDAAGPAVARAFVEAFAAGTDDALRAFEAAWRAPEAAARRSLEERVKGFGRLRDDAGRLEVRSIGGDEHSGRLVATGSKDGTWFVLEFVLVGTPPKLDGIRIEASSEEPPAVTALDAAARDAALDKLAVALESRYVFPKEGARLAALVRDGRKSGRWSDAASAGALATRVTTDLQAVVKDRHLTVRAEPAKGDAVRADVPHRVAGDHGFVESKLLDGGTGYIRLDSFEEGPAAQASAARAMEAVKDAKRLVFDLRQNGGGSSDMIAFLAGYLFEQPTLLNTFEDRNGRRDSEVKSAATVPGRRFPASVPIVVLTSSRTFSAAEEFAFDLQQAKRATIVGERTGGGAHPVQAVRLDDQLVVMLPYMRAVNPVSKTNWEGTGVAPDVAVRAEQALDTALQHFEQRVPGRG